MSSVPTTGTFALLVYKQCFSLFPQNTTLPPIFATGTLASSDTWAISENYSIIDYCISSCFLWKNSDWESKGPFHFFSASVPQLWTLSCDGFDHPILHQYWFPFCYAFSPFALEWHLHLSLSLIISAGHSIGMFCNVQCIYQTAQFIGLLDLFDVNALKKRALINSVGNFLCV